jgi:hypothetical protein
MDALKPRFALTINTQGEVTVTCHVGDKVSSMDFNDLDILIRELCELRSLALTAREKLGPADR